MHVPAQHSSLVAHVDPAATHADVHTDAPASFASHDPWQHVSPAPHGASRGRHGPGPKPQWPLAMSHVPQHGGTIDGPVHSSPSARQSVAAMTHVPRGVAHSPEQQSAFDVQGSAFCAHSVSPQMPALQPSEQHCEAAVHSVPSTTQYGAHCFDSDTSTGSHRPLQQSARVVQTPPPPVHVPACRQTFPSQRPEQQSGLVPQVAPFPRHVGADEQTLASSGGG